MKKTFILLAVFTAIFTTAQTSYASGKQRKNEVVSQKKLVDSWKKESKEQKNSISLKKKAQKALKNETAETMMIRSEEAKLTFSLSQRGGPLLTIEDDVVISYGNGWSFDEVEPWLYKLQFFSWTDSYWEVNTRDLTIHRIDTNYDTREELNYDLQVERNDEGRLLYIYINFSEGLFFYNPLSQRFSGYVDNNKVVDSSFWDACHIGNYEYHIRENRAPSYFIIKPEEQKLLYSERTNHDFCETITMMSTDLPTWEFRVNWHEGNHNMERIVVGLEEVKLSFDLLSLRGGIKIKNGNEEYAPIDHGENWEIRRVGSNFFHIKHRSWVNFYWAINTITKSVYEISNGEFGTVSGDAERINTIVNSLNGLNRKPHKFDLTFENMALLAVHPENDSVSISVQNRMLADTEELEGDQLVHRYDIRSKTWDSSYLSIDCDEERFSYIFGRNFGRNHDERKEVNGVEIISLNN